MMAFAYRKHSLALVLVMAVFFVHLMCNMPIINAISTIEDSKNELQEYGITSNTNSNMDNRPLQPSSNNNYQRNTNNNNNNNNGLLYNSKSVSNKRNMRSIYGLGPRMLQISRSKIPIELDLLVENGDDGDRSKRFDDYGHMRFGKRGGEEQFDDYGHMRFGRST